MAEPINRVPSSTRAGDMIARITPLQKIAIGAAALTLVGGIFLLGGGGDQTVMAAAYTDLEPADAAAVTDQLVSRGIDYELADGGRTVLVPRDQLYEVRVDLSAEGLPASNEGYALLDEQGLTTSEFRQRIDYQRALEGELARTLRSIDGVAAATVHLALPEDSIFIDEPGVATASVLITTTGTTPVSNEQVSAMVHLVSSSIKDLTPENVTIADSTGRVLTDGTGMPSGAAGDASSDFERELAAELRVMVGRVTGIENVAVNVQADLELTERTETTERFDTTSEDAGVVIAERTSNETYEGEGTIGDAGVLGPDGAPVAGDGATGNTSAYTRDDAERTFAVNRTVEQINHTPGTITQLSVAVLVDEAAVTAEQITSLEALVTTAAGIDPQRGDTVTVTALPFDVPEVDEDAMAAADAVEAAAASAQTMSMIRTVVIGLVLLVALFLAYRSTKKARREVSTPIDVEALRAAGVPAGALGSGDGGAPTELVPMDPASNQALDELSAMADQNPEDVARILQSWLADERQPT